MPPPNSLEASLRILRTASTIIGNLGNEDRRNREASSRILALVQEWLDEEIRDLDIQAMKEERALSSAERLMKERLGSVVQKIAAAQQEILADPYGQAPTLRSLWRLHRHMLSVIPRRKEPS